MAHRVASYVNEAYQSERKLAVEETEETKDLESNRTDAVCNLEAGEFDDPWKLPELVNTLPGWKELDRKGKAKRIMWEYIFRQVFILCFLYMFVCSLDLLSSGFKLLGGRTAGKAFAESELLTNPVAGLMIGVLGTVLLQSSSTTTSIVVSMVGANILTVKAAISMIMGANIGTTVTNTIVSLGQANSQNDFRRAFGGATVHDMFNWLTVLVLLPMEAASNYLFYLTDAIINSFSLQQYKNGDVKLLQVITEPFTNLVVQVDKDAISRIVLSNGSSEDIILAKLCYSTAMVTFTTNATNYSVPSNSTVTNKMCTYMFDSVAGVWKDESIGAIVLVFALLLLCACLYGLVKMLQSALKGSVAAALKRVVNADIPTKCGAYVTGYLYIIVGALLTLVLQSSSVLTSALTPLVGLGVLSLERMYPLTLGSNVGTTFTAILAALASDGSTLDLSLQVALCHLFFNLSGILLWYPIPFMRRVPINLAMKLGNITAKYRWFALAYIVILYFILPGAIFALSLAGWRVLVGVLAPVAVVLIVVVVVNALQRKRPSALPSKLRSWDFLPLWMHSLEPLDRLIMKACCCCKCCKKLSAQNVVSQDPTSGSDQASQQNKRLPVITYNTSV